MRFISALVFAVALIARDGGCSPVLAQDRGVAAQKSASDSRVVSHLIKSVDATINGERYTARLMIKDVFPPDNDEGRRVKSICSFDDPIPLTGLGSTERREFWGHHPWPFITGVEVSLTPVGKNQDAEVVVWREYRAGFTAWGSSERVLLDLFAEEKSACLYLVTCPVVYPGRDQYYRLYVISSATPSMATEYRWMSAADNANADFSASLGRSLLPLVPVPVDPRTGFPAYRFERPPRSTYHRGWYEIEPAPLYIDVSGDDAIVRITGVMATQPRSELTGRGPEETDFFPYGPAYPVLVTYDLRTDKWTDLSDERYHLRGTQRKIEISDHDLPFRVVLYEPPPGDRFLGSIFPMLDVVTPESRARFLAMWPEYEQFQAAWPEYEKLQAAQKSACRAAFRAFLEKWFPEHLAEYDRRVADAANPPFPSDQNPAPPEAEAGNATQPQTPTDPGDPGNPARAVSRSEHSLTGGKCEGRFPWLLAVIPAAVIVLFTGAVVLFWVRHRRSAS